MKRNIIIILLIPFLIAILGVVTMSTTYNMVDADIVSIEWGYRDVEGFKLEKDTLRYILHAEGVNQRGTKAANNKLTWSVTNKNKNEEEHATIEMKNGMSYLNTKSTGEVYITCQNEKGNGSGACSDDGSGYVPGHGGGKRCDDL